MTPQILIVEDDDVQRSLWRRILGRYDTTLCANGMEALDEDWTQYDLVILDYLLPGMTGGQVLERAVRQYAAAMPPVIVFTALDQRCISHLIDPDRNVLVQQKVGTPETVRKGLIRIVERALANRRTQ